MGTGHQSGGRLTRASGVEEGLNQIGSVCVGYVVSQYVQNPNGELSWTGEALSA